MSKFAISRTANDLAAVLWGRHNDAEITLMECKAIIRRLRAHVDLLAGSSADEEFRERVVEDMFIGILQNTEFEKFHSLTDFEVYARKLLSKKFN